MVTASGRWTLRAVAAIGLGLLLTGATVAAKDDEKKDPLREEILKFNSITGEDAQRDKLVGIAKDKDKAKKIVTEAGKMLKESKGKESPFNHNSTSMLARLALFTKQYDVAEKFYSSLVESSTKLKSGSKMTAAYHGLIDVYLESKQYALASEMCEKAVDAAGPKEFEDEKIFFLEKYIKSLAKEEKYDEALRRADTLVKETGGSWYFLQTKGWVLREQGKLPAAIEAYSESLEKIDENKGLKSEVRDRFKDATRYILTGLYVDNKDVEKAAKELQTLIKRHPDNPTYKNDLGFIWCDHDMNLEESEKLIKDALDLDKKAQEKAKKDGDIDEVKPNAAYLDSLGWVYFKQKKYKEAIEPLKQASADAEDGAHLEIWDHLADCYMALGQKKDAISTWEKGLKYEDLSKRDTERRRKVSEKLKKARADKE